MSGPVTIYGASDVAEMFKVERATVSNWCLRFPDDIPTPDMVTTDGRKYWLSLDGWRQWATPRSKQIQRQIEKLQAQLEALESSA